METSDDPTKESIKTKPKSGNCFCIRVFKSIKLRLIVMSTNLEYRAGERQRKRERRRQASEAQREKGRQRSRVRDKKRRHFFVGRTTWKFCSGGDKMRNASRHQLNAWWKWAAVKKVNENTYDTSSKKKFLEVSRCGRAKQRQRNVQKKCAARAKCFC